MISARGLRKSFGDFEAVKGIDVEVRKGEAFGFLGPNGAGKSSTMRMIASVSPVTSGELRILGMDPATDGPAIRGRLGVCPQEDTLDNELNVRDNLYIYGRYFGIDRATCRERAFELLEFAQITEKAKSKVEDLSGGMKRRLTIARSLINNPDLLLLDEPTTGLDPQARHVLWDQLFRLKQAGVTLVITSVTPACLSRKSWSHSTCRACGSSPVVGSSSSSRSGLLIRLRAMVSRRFMPPERSSTLAFALSVIWANSSSSWARSRQVARSMPK